ncbi:MAG: hypothetical protein HYT83_04320 [Candidatus Levybacteria bacterium]|nr:hypothetical protein [Candidatus Levybacteria bacterium]
MKGGSKNMKKNSKWLKWGSIAAIVTGTAVSTIALVLIIQGANITSELITLVFGAIIVSIGIRKLNQ